MVAHLSSCRFSFGLGKELCLSLSVCSIPLLSRISSGLWWPLSRAISLCASFALQWSSLGFAGASFLSA